MKTLYFADLHGHNYREFATLGSDGVNSRLVNQLEVLDAIALSAREHKVDDIRFLGDLLHLKNNMDTFVLRSVIGKMAELAEEFPLLILPGNHDYRLWTSNPVVLEMLGDFAECVTIVDEPKIVNVDGGLKVYAEPYTRKVVELNERLKKLKPEPDVIFLGHQDMLGMQYGGFTVEQGLDVELLSKKFKWSFIGHYHAPVKAWENVVSIGAPLQHNFSDVGGKRGWWIFDEEKNEVTFVQNNISPQFIDIKVEGVGEIDEVSCKDCDLKADFFRVKVTGDAPPKGLEQIRWKRVSYEVATKVKSRGDLKFSDSKEAVIEKYVNLRGGDLDKKKLIELGRRYV